MNKIALLITGTTRNYVQNYPTWKKYLLDIYHVDIFFHTYDVVGYQKQENKLITPDMTQYVDIKTVVSLIKPIKYKVDNLEHMLSFFRNTMPTTFTNKSVAHPEFIKAQLYSIFQANLLKKEHEKSNNFKYDLVIKIRFDTLFRSAFDKTDLNLIKSNNKIILCGNPGITKMTFKNGCFNCIQNLNNLKKISCKNHTPISDIVVISNSQNIDVYADSYITYDRFMNSVYKKCLDKEINHKYIIKKYPNNAILYRVPDSELEIYFPEKYFAKVLEDYMLVNYKMGVDTNRMII